MKDEWVQTPELVLTLLRQGHLCSLEGTEAKTLQLLVIRETQPFQQTLAIIKETQPFPLLVIREIES